MMEQLPISVFIIAKNEQERIKAAIESVKYWAAEVIVIDSGSTDNTVALSESLGAKVIYNQWQGYVKQKIFGESKCNNQWILNIDADEEVSKELANEIAALFNDGEPEKKAYICRMVIVHRFDRNIRWWAPETKSIRFYHKQFAGFAEGDLESLCHDSVVQKEGLAKEQVGLLKQAILHRSLKSISQAVEKANFYSGQQAEELFQKGRKPSRLRIALEPILWFFKAFILRRYFIYGFNGFIDSMIFAFARFIRLAKTREKYLEKDFHS